MKIVAFAQLHEELRKGNLENWYRSLAGCDQVYVFDQGSKDGSHEVYARDPRTVVISSPINAFDRELECKADLLERLLQDHPDTDWVFWMDGDTILDGRLLADGAKGFRELCSRGIKDGIGAYKLGHYNLWRSDTYYRVDNQYHGLHEHGVCALWRNNGQLRFPRSRGLHVRTAPDGLGSCHRVDYSLVHRGFATEPQIVEKHRVYASRGQNGWELDRLVDEGQLRVEPIPREVLPDWYPIRDGGASPIGKTPVVELARKWGAPADTSTYDALYGGTSYGREPNKLQVDWLLGRELAGIRTALDLGCGKGHVVRPLRALGVRTIGVDGSRVLMEREWAGDSEFVLADLLELRLGATFDLVVCHDVLEHLPEAAAEAALASVARHASGYVSLTIADHPDAWFGTELHVNRKPFDWWRKRIAAYFEVIEAETALEGALHLFWCRARPATSSGLTAA